MNMNYLIPANSKKSLLIFKFLLTLLKNYGYNEIVLKKIQSYAIYSYQKERELT